MPTPTVLRTDTMTPKAVDLFSGCGGLTLGLKQAGFSVLGAIEIDSLAARTYAANHPEVHLWQKDIRRLTATSVRDELGLEEGDLDLLAGCPPCQGFSTMRTLNGKLDVTDPRNDLISEFLRFAKRLLPKCIMLENVPGLKEDPRFLTFCGQLEKLGYKVKYGVLNALDYGVPQRRRRLILVASRSFEVSFAPPAEGG